MLAVVRHRKALRQQAVVVVWDERVVDLKQEPGVDHRQVLLTQRVRQRVHIRLVRRIVLIGHRRLYAGRRGQRQERLRLPSRYGGQRPLEFRDVPLDRVPSSVSDRSDAEPPAKPRKGGVANTARNLRWQPHGAGDPVVDGVIGGELLPVLAHQRATAHGGGVRFAVLDAAQALDHVLRPGHFAVLAVVHDVEARVHLLTHRLGHCGCEAALEAGRVVVLSELLGAERLHELGGPHQAAHMGSENALSAALHASSPGSVRRHGAGPRRAHPTRSQPTTTSKHYQRME